MDQRIRRSREIQEAINDVLLRTWDPIGIQDEPHAKAEYSQYVARVYRLLASGAMDAEIARTLERIEVEEMGVPASAPPVFAEVIRKLRAIDVRLG